MDKEDVRYICVCIYTMQYYSSIKKSEIMPFAATWLDLEIVLLNEVRERKTNINYMWNIKFHMDKYLIPHCLYVESKKWYK